MVKNYESIKIFSEDELCRILDINLINDRFMEINNCILKRNCLKSFY